MDAPRRGQVFKSSGNVLEVDFVSDYSNEEPKPIGFEAHWTEEGERRIIIYDQVDETDKWQLRSYIAMSFHCLLANAI